MNTERSTSTLDTPTTDPESRLQVLRVGHGLYRVTARYGFMEPPDVPAAIAAARRYGLTARDDDTTYYLAQLTLLASDRIGMAAWRDKLFIVLARNARRATNFFRIPAHQVVEIGIQLEL